MRIDNLQYCNWSEAVFQELRAGHVDAIHVTIAYHEGFRAAVRNLEQWNRWFETFPDLIVKGKSAADIDHAQASGRTAVFFGFQTPNPIEDDIGLIEVWHDLGLRFMQLTYNNQSLLASGCYEDDDAGLTRMGREVVAEMNRVGLVIDMSHSADRSTIEAAEASTRPIAITHANPYAWHPVPRNKRDAVLSAVVEGGGMLGFSLYPHHLAGGSDCTLPDFCAMVARTADQFGVAHLGFGSDLCQGQPDSVVDWMRRGTWTKATDAPARFPAQPQWFQTNRDWDKVEAGLAAVGFNADEVAALMGGNWYRFYAENFSPRT